MSAKASLYAQSLDAVRAQGILWTVPFPTDLAGKLHLAASAQQDGPGQDCRELLRKFTKHNSARELTALTASTEYGLYLLVQKAAASFDADASYGNSFHHSPSSTTNSRGKLPFPPLIARADRPAAEKLISALENGIRTGSLGVGRESENNSAKIVRAWGLYMVGAFSDALEGLQSVARGAAGGGESYDRMLKVLGFAVEGFCHERLDDLSAAMSAYRSAVSLYEDFTASNGARVRPTTEMDKSAEEVLFRLCWWSRGSAARMSPFPPHRQYISLLAPLYTSSGLFRPRKSLLVHSSLRNLLLASDTAKTSPVEWLKEIESINVSQEVVVRGCTALPRAGSINAPYLGFLEGVVAGWKLSGGGKRGAGEVVRILYAALTHTFQSPRLLRYLILALTVLGSHVEAGKAVTLYVEMFDKTRETGGVEVSKGLREFAKTKDGEVAEKVTEVTEDEDSDIDSDLLFIETALFGARLRSRFLVDAKGAYALCQRAREIFDEGKEAGLQQNKVVESAIERGLGVSLGALTNADADLETRPTHHSAALSHLSNSIILTPTSWESHFALAYLLFELRQLVPALESAKKAVELNKSNTDCWHLLGLLVCATSRVPGATGGMGEGLLVLETGIEQGEGQPVLENREMEDDDHDDGETERNTKSNGVVRENEGLPEIVISRLSYPAVPSATPVAAETEVPQVPATQSSLPTDETDKLIARVQLRMTKNVVIELMEGAEAALLDQQGLMGYFAAEFASIASEGDERKAKALPLLETAAPRASLSRRLSFRSIRAEATSEGESGSPLRATRSRSNSLRSFIGQSNGNVPTAGTNYSNTSLVSIGSTGPKRETNPRATKLLVQLWLLSAASFRRAGRMEECRGAIAEAEKIDGDDEEVWLQYAQYCIATGASELARTCLIKGLSFSLNHAPSLIVLSRLYLSTPAVLPPVSHSQSHTATAPQNLKLPYAESLLDSLTKSHGWDIPEAWFELSRCYKDTGRTEREKECLVWALQLETTRSVRTLRESVQRVL